MFQPGDYAGQIAVKSDSPYPVAPVNVKMHVLPPGNWGKIQGTVHGQPCSGGPVPLAAQIRINKVGAPDVGFSLRSAVDGSYGFWLQRGRYDIIVSRDGWIPQVVRVQVDGGFVLIQDFTLQPFQPCAPRGSNV